MRQILACATLAAFLLLAWNAPSAAQPAKKAPVKKTGGVQKAPVPAAKRAPATRAPLAKRYAGKTTARPATARPAASRTATTARKGVRKGPAAPTWRSRQMAPTAERYRQIQQALAAKGYLRPEDATGVWDQNSMDALKRFQAEQKIDSTGKINSLSLIALGLGPKHDTAAAKPPAAGQPPVPESPGRM